MKETTKYEIIAHWIDTCETDQQLNNLREAIEKRFKLDDITKDDLLLYWIDNKKRRQWAIDIVYEYPKLSSLSYDDHQPTDIA